jgi:hypothetical protein
MPHDEPSIIYVQLLEEGTVAYRPTRGEQIRSNAYRILSTDDYDSKDEVWEFPPGSIVECVEETHYGSAGPETSLVARYKVESRE